MKTKTTFLTMAFAAMLLLASLTQIYALNYTVNFTASGVTNDVGSVQVQNLTKGTSLTLLNGNSLTLTDVATAIDKQSTITDGIHISQNASTGTSAIAFYASQTGNAQMAVYALDGRKVVGQNTPTEEGDNSFELSLPAGMYILRVSGTGYAYSAKLQSQTSVATQAEIKFLTHSKVESPDPLMRKAPADESITMTYTAGDQLLYTATSGTYIASVYDVSTENKTINFVFSTLPTSAIPAGTFVMGSPVTEINRESDENQFTVTLSAFRISKYEVTNAQYAAFLNSKNIGRTGKYAAAEVPNQALLFFSNVYGSIYDFGLHHDGTKWIPVTGYENGPVNCVTWYGAYEYAKDMGATLPTEAQWEYACRAGTTTPFYTGNCLTDLQANYLWSDPYNTCSNTVSTPLRKTQPVGSYAPNAYGLYDMLGNVWEWCSDLSDVYPTTPQTNPTGATSGWMYVLRGGSYYDQAKFCRSAERTSNVKSAWNYFIGFRLVFP